MTMPKGFATGKNYNYCTKCPHIEQDHKRVMQITKGTFPKGMQLPPSMVETRKTACNLCDCDWFVDKDMARRMQKEAQNEQIRRAKQAEKNSRPKGETADKAVLGLWVGSMVIGFITTIIAIIVLHFAALFVGLALLFIPMLIANIFGGSGSSNSSRGHNDYDAFFMNRWGSYQAKKNMRRGYRRSKK